MFFGSAASRNLFVSGITAVVFAALAATGLSMEFLFEEPGGPHESGGHQWRGGTAHSAETTSDGAEMESDKEGGRQWQGGPVYLGLRKGDCEEIHEWLSYTFVALIVFHLVLHAKWIWTVSRGRDPRWQRVRGALLLTVACLLIGLMLLPLALAITR